MGRNVDNRPYVTLSEAAINPAGQWVGIVGTELTLGSVSTMLRDVASSASSDAVLFIVNRVDRTVIGASNREISFHCSGEFVNSLCTGTVTLLKPDSEYFPESYQQIEAMVNSHYGGWAGITYGSIFRTTIEGNAKFVNIAPLDTGKTNLKWAVVLMVNQSTFLARVNKSRDVAIGVFCALLTLSMALTFLFAMGITKPLAVVTNKMDGLFKAKVSRSQLPENASDVTIYKESNLVEIRHLQASFEQMKSTIQGFQKFVHPLVVQRIVWNEPGAADICVARKEVSIFFSDIKDFTVLSERLPIAVLITILSKYLDFMTEIIARYDGIVADFIGDAIMAFWEDNPEHATMAVQCALDQQNAMGDFNQMLLGKGYEPMSVRMGLHVGMVLVGNIGSVHRLKYGCVGDDVNLCSRLEGLNKRYNTSIVLSDECKNKLPPDMFETRALEQVIVKGRSSATYLHELCGNRDTVHPNIAERNAVFEDLRKRLEALDDAEGEAGQELLEEVEKYLMSYPSDTAGTLLRDRLTSGNISGPVKLNEK
ncbi:nucleotide cyclase [Powellomyces hirtus]|nr:nucleotide cyclase [Powellomyces hirtus]